MRRRLMSVGISVVCAFSVGAGSASAQIDDEGGLQVDPGSPSGREYAIPLDDARRRGAAGRRTDTVTPGVGSDAPAFGEGVGSEDPPANRDRAKTEGGGGTDSRAGGTRSGESEGSGGATGGDERADVTRPVSVGPADTSADAGTGSGQVAAIGGIGGGVLLLGVAAGFLLRRRSG